nr:hypothetical protein [Tanacetum cinerariifolium]
MATTIEQQVALDEALVPSTQRFLFFKAFLVTADVPEIYMQEFWATAYPWRSFAAIINKCLTGKSSGYNSLRLSQAQILWGLYHTRSINYAFLIWEDFVYQVEHKNQKKSNEMYYPRFTKVIIHHFMSKDPSIPRRNKINCHYVRDDSIFSTIKVVSRHQNTQQYGAMLHIELTNDEIRNTKAYKEYYAFATGEAAPKPKANARRKRSGSDTSITPPTATTTPTTTVAVTPKLTAAVKGKQPAKAKSPSDPLEVARTEAQQLKIVLRSSRQQTYISQLGGSSTDEGTGSKPGVPDVPTDESEELTWNSSDDEGDNDQEKVDDDDDDEDKNGDERDDDDQDQEVAKHDDKDDAKESEEVYEEGESDEEDDNEETRDEESFDPIPQTPESSKNKGDGEEDQGVRISKEERLNKKEEAEELYQDQEISSVSSHFVTSMLNPPSDASMESIFATASSPSVNAQLEAEVLTRSSNSSRTSYAVAADLSKMELKKLLIENMEGNKFIQRSDEQRNLYKALVNAYEADKIILDSYGEIVILKRRRDDDDQDEGPSAGSDRGSKRQREGKEPESASASLETATRSAGRVDTLTPKLLAGPTFELMKGSCTSLIKLEYHLEEVYKATTDQLDWVNPEGQHNGTLNDVLNALDDRLKGIRMQYLPQTIWRKGDKDRAVAMIQAIDKMLKTRRIMKSLERFIGGRLYKGDFRMLQRTI